MNKPLSVATSKLAPALKEEERLSRLLLISVFGKVLS